MASSSHQLQITQPPTFTFSRAGWGTQLSNHPFCDLGHLISLPRYARGLLVRVALDRHGRELLRKSQAEITQLMRRREELGEGTRDGQLEIGDVRELI